MADEKDGKKEKKKRINMSDAWREAKALVVAHRGRLAFGAVLMLITPPGRAGVARVVEVHH